MSTTQQTMGSTDMANVGFLNCRVFYSCVLSHYFMVGFSLCTENKVIIFSPFIDVCKYIAVGVLYVSF